jgi:hypothetical protein
MEKTRSRKSRDTVPLSPPMGGGGSLSHLFVAPLWVMLPFLVKGTINLKWFLSYFVSLKKTLAIVAKHTNER